MINLMTHCRRVATLFVTTTALLVSAADAQEIDNSTLLLDEIPSSVLEQLTPFGSELSPEIEPALTAPKLGGLPSATALEDYTTMPQMPANVDVLTRGPLHEAFATAHQSTPESSPLVAQAPPELIDEVPPEYKPEGNNVQWIPGYWAWDDAQQDFIWISGVWRDVPPQRRWVPGYWDKADLFYRWVSGFWAEQTQQELGYLPQPPATIEQGPSTAAPNENHFYVPGNWHYQDDRYRWLSGHWQPIVENWIWIPAQYVWTPSGCIYRSGYWDYEFDHRGTCFAPVHFKQPVYLATNYSYRPSFAISLNIDFLTHLFVRPHSGHYYYGDWYGSNFVNFGYRPWVNYQSHFRSYDPLLTYYHSRRSSFDRSFSTVQYLNQQHRFYANNVSYRPRPTFVAQFNFSKNNFKQNNQYSDYLRKSNYVRSYSNVRKTSQRNSIGGQGFKQTNNRYVSDLKSRSVKYHQIGGDELRSNRQKIEQLSKLQRERKKNEIRFASNNVNARTSIDRYRTLKLPSNGATNQNLRREFPTSQRQQFNQRTQTSRNSSDFQRRVIDQQQRNSAVNFAAERSRQQREQQSRLQQQQRESQNQARDRSRQLQQQQRDQENARIARDRQRDEQNRRAQADRQRRAADQQRRDQDQARRSRDQQRQADANRNREARSRQARLDADRAAQQKSQRDAARRAQLQQSQQDQARRARDQQRKADADRRARESRSRQAQQDAARKAQQKSQQDAARRAQQKKSQQDQARRAREQQRKAQADRARQAQQKAQRDAAKRAQRQKSQQEAARRSKKKK